MAARISRTGAGRIGGLAGLVAHRLQASAMWCGGVHQIRPVSRR
jgi:hypothetical protein